MNFIYSPNLLELKKLAYQNTGIVYLDKPEEETKEFILELQAITSSTIISAYLFREHGFRDFTVEDWKNMYLQYVCTYGYPTEEQVNEFYGKLTENNMEEKSSLEVLKLQSTDANKVTIEPEILLTAYLKSIFESKIPLRDTQLKMLYCAPIDMISKCYSEAKFTIKETRNIVLTVLFQNADDDVVLFSDFDSILRFVVSNYGYDRTTKLPLSETKLDKIILSKTDLRLPTAIKKVILGSINKVKRNTKSIEQLKKYQQFWKRIFQQTAYTTEAKMKVRFPFAFEVKEKLYEKANLRTDNTEIEYFRQQGDLGTAFSIELGNPGQMVRRLLSYIRYPVGTKYASKGDTLNSGSCKDDVADLLNDTMFDSALSRTSPKLLLQLLKLLANEEIYKTRTEVKVYSGKHKTKYSASAPLPAVNKEFAEICIAKINKVLGIVLKDRNEALGKVYLDLTTARLPIQFSGRLDTTDAMSGGYYPSGSEIDLKVLIQEKLKKNESLTTDDIVLRAGLAWRGKRSTDLDLSTTIVGKDNRTATLYFGKPTMYATLSNGKKELIGVSSGDITRCSETVFSAELVDFKYNATKETGIAKMLSSFNLYSGAKASELEVYFFVEVVTTDDMVVKGKKITDYDMQNAAIAVRVNCKQNLHAGFVFDLENDKLVVVNKDIESSMFTNIQSKSSSDISEMLKLNNIFLNDVLYSFIEPKQVVFEISEADTIITTNQYFDMPDKKVYNLATKAEECQELYM